MMGTKNRTVRKVSMGVVSKSFSVAYSYLLKNYSKAEIAMIEPELQSFAEVISTDETQVNSYESLQNFLSKINEKESGRKKGGCQLPTITIAKLSLLLHNILIKLYESRR